MSSKPQAPALPPGVATAVAYCRDVLAGRYAAAVTRDQARILFDTARQMVLRCPEIRRRYGVEALANAVWQERSGSHLRPVSSDAKAVDGLNVQVAVCDEIASHRTSEVYDV